MRKLWLLAASVALAGCGVDPASIVANNAGGLGNPGAALQARTLNPQAQIYWGQVDAVRASGTDVVLFVDHAQDDVGDPDTPVSLLVTPQADLNFFLDASTGSVALYDVKPARATDLTVGQVVAVGTQQGTDQVRQLYIIEPALPLGHALRLPPRSLLLQHGHRR